MHLLDKVLKSACDLQWWISPVGCFSWYFFRRIGLLVADTIHLHSPGREILLAAGWKNVHSVWRVPLKWANLSFSQGWSLFFAYASPHFLPGALGVSAFVTIHFYFILFPLPESYWPGDVIDFRFSVNSSRGAFYKMVDKFTFLGSSVSSTEKDIDTRLTKAWTDIDRLSILWKSNLTDKMKRSFFQAAIVSILLYGYTTWTLTKRLENKLDGNYTRMLRAILNKSCRKHPTRHQLYGHLPPITKTIQVRRTRHAEHCWRSKDELISDVLLWTPAYGQAKAGRSARTYIQQLCDDTGCSPEDLPETMNDREKWRERVRDIRASGRTWWWWWWHRKLSSQIKSPYISPLF